MLHRLLAPRSDCAAERWRADYPIAGLEELELHHLYRAMAWLGEPLADQRGATPFSPRCIKDHIEEALFARQRDLFSELELVFFDTTSIYFEGEGGESLGQRVYSKDHRPGLKQLIVGAVLDAHGRPIACELWPGNTTDVRTLLPIAERLTQRFGIARVCLVADRCMISAETLDALEQRDWPYILGARMRRQKEVSTEVLSRAGRYHMVREAPGGKDAPAPLKVKQVRVEDRRYIVCLNENQAKKDAADREALLDRLAAAGQSYEWADVLRDLEALQEIEVAHLGKRFRLRTEARGSCGAVFRALGVAFPPTVQQIQEVPAEV